VSGKRVVNLTPKEAADLIGCSVSSVYRYVSEGHLRAIKRPGKNGALTIPDDSVQQFLKACEERCEQ